MPYEFMEAKKKVVVFYNNTRWCVHGVTVAVLIPISSINVIIYNKDSKA